VRVLVAHPGPAYSVADIHAGWVEALRELGEHVVEFPLGDALTFYDSVLIEAGSGLFRKALSGQQATDLAVDRLCGALWKIRPDLLIIVSGFFVRHEVLDQARRDGTRVVALCTESPYEDKRQAELAEHVDVCVIDDPTNIGIYPPNTIYLPKAFRPSIHHPGPADPLLACDLAFVGTGYPSRVEFLEQMDLASLDILLAGNWMGLAEDSPLRQHIPGGTEDCLDNERTAGIYRSARVGLNLYRREAEAPELSQGWSMGPRELEMAACGTFFLRDPRGEGDELLPMLPTFASPQEAGELLRYWLARPEQRRTAALGARAAVADRTFANHAAALLRRLHNIKGK
jgi:spore maturation protein CgeB